MKDDVIDVKDLNRLSVVITVNIVLNAVNHLLRRLAKNLEYFKI
jgi:hypothetical protein